MSHRVTFLFVCLCVPMIAAQTIPSGGATAVAESNAKEDPEEVSVMIIEVSEDGAEVWVGDESIGLSPVGPYVTTAGDYIVSVKKAGYVEQTKMVRLPAGGAVSVSLAMERATGFLYLRSIPEGARVLIDGEFVGMTPLEQAPIPIGTRSVALMKGGYDKWEGTVDIATGETAEFAVTLVAGSKTKTGAFVRSMFFPGWGQRYRGASNLGNMFSIAAICGLGACFFTVSDHNSKMDDYEDYNSVSNPDRHTLDRLYDEADKATKVGNVVIIATGLIWAANVAEAALGFPAGEAGVVQVEPMESDIGVRAMVSIQVR
jgi:hypothetical protein